MVDLKFMLVDDRQVEGAIQQALAAHDAMAPPIEVQRVDAIPQTILARHPWSSRIWLTRRAFSSRFPIVDDILLPLVQA